VNEQTRATPDGHSATRASYDDTLEALGSALDLKDAETEGHVQRVTAFTISIASRGVPLPYLAGTRARRFLHDIGKMAIPDSILSKPGPLDNDEKPSCARTAKKATTC